MDPISILSKNDDYIDENDSKKYICGHLSYQKIPQRYE